MYKFKKYHITRQMLVFFLSFLLGIGFIFLVLFYYITNTEKSFKQVYHTNYSLQTDVDQIKKLVDNQYNDLTKWFISKKDDVSLQNVITRYQYDWPTQKKKVKQLLENRLKDSLTLALHNILINIDSLFELQRRKLWEPQIATQFEKQEKRTLESVQNMLQFHESSNKSIVNELSLLSSKIVKNNEKEHIFLLSTLQIQKIALVGGFIIILFYSFIFINYYQRTINNPLSVFFNSFSTLSRGKLSEAEIEHENWSEKGVLTPLFQQLLHYFHRAIAIRTYIENLTKKNYSTIENKFESSDQVGEALKKLKNTLLKEKQNKEVKEWEKQRLSEFKHVFEDSYEDITELSKMIVKQYIHSFHAKVGNIFILDENKEHNLPIMKLYACYAFDRLKDRKAEYYLGDGLLGQVWEEQEILTITDLPKDYLDITSALGEASPTSIILIPFISQNKVYGIIELASFSKFTNRMVSFSKKIASRLGVLISNTLHQNHLNLSKRNNKELAFLLEEQKEELLYTTKTYESTEKVNIQLKKEKILVEDTIDSFFATAEYDNEGLLIKANRVFEVLFGHYVKELKGQHHATLLKQEYRNSQEYQDFWKKIKKGHLIIQDEVWETDQQDEVNTKVYYRPILNDKKELQRVHVFIQNKLIDNKKKKIVKK